jgi:hemerythrin-like domain-containing protein
MNIPKRLLTDYPTMSDTIAALSREHSNIEKMLELLESEILAIEVGKTPDNRLMQDIMRYMAQYSDRFHHPKEDLIFAQLLRRDPDIRAEVQELIEEHVSIGLAGREFTELVSASHVDSVDARERLATFGFSYIRALREHILKEETKLFPLANEVLTETEWQLIDEAVNAIDDPLFDEMTADDYQRLYRLIIVQ